MVRPPDSWRFSLSAFPIPENPPPTPSAGVRITGKPARPVSRHTVKKEPLDFSCFQLVEMLFESRYFGIDSLSGINWQIVCYYSFARPSHAYGDWKILVQSFLFRRQIFQMYSPALSSCSVIPEFVDEVVDHCIAPSL